MMMRALLIAVVTIVSLSSPSWADKPAGKSVIQNRNVPPPAPTSLERGAVFKALIQDGLPDLMDKGQLGGINRQIEAATMALEPRIAETLQKTGQHGVLLFAEVTSVFANGPTHYDLTNDNVYFVGAGRTPIEVYTLWKRQPGVWTKIPEGHHVDEEHSVFFWFTKENGTWTVSTPAAALMFRDERLNYSNEMVLASMYASAREAAFSDLITAAEQQVKGEGDRQRVAALREAAGTARKQEREIKKKLDAELEHQERLRANAQTLAIASSIFSFGAQISLAKLVYERDEAATLSKASKQSDLAAAMDDLVRKSAGQSAVLQAQHDKLQDQTAQIEVESLIFIRAQKIPVDDIPALQSP